MSDYNYEHFDGEDRVTVSDLWRSQPTVMNPVGSRRQDQAVFHERLRRNGVRAVDEFKRAEGFWRDPPPE